MAELSTTWTDRDYVAFTAGTMASIASCIENVQANLHRGTLSESTVPTQAQVHGFLIRAKQKLAEKYNFTWRRRYVYATTTDSVWQYALPADYAGGVVILRDLTQDKVLTNSDNASFDYTYPDPAGESSKAPDEYTIKDRELWLSAPANGEYTLELEYPRTGDDTTAVDISWLPEIARFKICDYATYRAFVLLQNWDAAAAFKSEWMDELVDAKHGNALNKWATTGYQIKNWHYQKI